MEEAIAAGEELLRNGQPWEAIQQIEPTLQHARGALRIRARLALARASMKNPEWLRRAEAHLQDVLQEDPTRLEAYLLLGDIYKASQLRTRATTMYRKALDLQPGNRHALRELARLEGTAHAARRHRLPARLPEEALSGCAERDVQQTKERTHDRA